MKRVRFLIPLFVLTALAVMSALPVSAESVSFGGTIDTGDSTMPVVFISTPNCTGQGATPVYYESRLFSVAAAGTYTISMTSPGDVASMYLYAGSFNPAAGMTNCVAADNSGGIEIVFDLEANSPYYVVVFHDQFDTSVLPYSYSVTISIPEEIEGDGICVGTGDCTAAVPQPGCDVLVDIPSTAVGATFVADAAAYWKPGELVDPAVTLVAGKNVRAIGLDSTGEYYKILFECDFLWVKANTLGPNYDAVWGGRTLPTDVVN